MRIPGSTTAAMAALLAAAVPLASARADDASHVPGGNRTGQDFSHLNVQRQAAPASPLQVAAQAPAPQPAIQAPAAPHAGTNFSDVEALLHRASAAMAAHRLQQAATELDQAETRLLNARYAGSELAGQAITRVNAARSDLGRGDAAAARRATEGLEQMLRRS